MDADKRLIKRLSKPLTTSQAKAAIVDWRAETAIEDEAKRLRRIIRELDLRLALTPDVEVWTAIDEAIKRMRGTE